MSSVVPKTDWHLCRASSTWLNCWHRLPQSSTTTSSKALSRLQHPKLRQTPTRSKAFEHSLNTHRGSLCRLSRALPSSSLLRHWVCQIPQRQSPNPARMRLRRQAPAPHQQPHNTRSFSLPVPHRSLPSSAALRTCCNSLRNHPKPLRSPVSCPCSSSLSPGMRWSTGPRI